MLDSMLSSKTPIRAASSAGGREPAPAAQLGAWSLVAAVNNESVLQQTLLKSPVIDSRCQVILKRSFSSAGQAYNSGLTEANHDVVVFAHQDVYFPEGWTMDLERAILQLSEDDPGWGVLGVFGVTTSPQRELEGHCYSTGLGRVLGAPFDSPVRATSLDELTLVIRRSSGLTFDERLPGFHLYGTDICLQALTRGMRSYIIPAFCIHNSNGLAYYPTEYWRGYGYMQRKWREHLPVHTSCVTITRSSRPMFKQIIMDSAKRLFGSPRVGKRTSDVSELYKRVVTQSDTLREHGAARQADGMLVESKMEPN